MCCYSQREGSPRGKKNCKKTQEGPPPEFASTLKARFENFEQLMLVFPGGWGGEERVLKQDGGEQCS